RLLMHAVCFAFDFALASAGNNRPARIAIIAITTSNSISVKPGRRRCRSAKNKKALLIIRMDGLRLSIAKLRGICNAQNIRQCPKNPPIGPAGPSHEGSADSRVRVFLRHSDFSRALTVELQISAVPN